ncbi:hypothetical protein CsatB_009158 [Cannabis sativa]
MLETGKIARFANGAVVLGVEETKVLSTVTSSKGDDVRDFLPLTVDYQEKQFAQGVIPNTFMRREGAPKERELLCGRLIDRPIRPLFPSGFYHEVQVMASVLSSDGKQDPDVMAANATSAALMLSDIPWGGPIGMIRVGRTEGQLIVNPTMDEVCIIQIFPRYNDCYNILSLGLKLVILFLNSLAYAYHCSYISLPIDVYLTHELE